jgi:alkylated DNA nucleotide flippase Atl1
VVNADGRIGNYAFGGERKQRLLEQEGILFHEGRVLNFDQVKYRF